VHPRIRVPDYICDNDACGTAPLGIAEVEDEVYAAIGQNAMRLTGNQSRVGRGHGPKRCDVMRNTGQGLISRYRGA